MLTIPKARHAQLQLEQLSLKNAHRLFLMVTVNELKITFRYELVQLKFALKSNLLSV